MLLFSCTYLPYIHISVNYFSKNKMTTKWFLNDFFGWIPNTTSKATNIQKDVSLSLSLSLSLFFFLSFFLFSFYLSIYLFLSFFFFLSLVCVCLCLQCVYVCFDINVLLCESVLTVELIDPLVNTPGLKTQTSSLNNN